MTEVWTGRKSQWSSETSGFESVAAMQVWCEKVAHSEPILFGHLLVPVEEGQLVRFHSQFGDVQWRSISELSSPEKKALRWDYHKWKARVSEDIDSERRPIGFTIPGSNGLASSAPFKPAHVKLFLGKKKNGDEVWSLVWGMNLDNEKENFLPSYASRKSTISAGGGGERDSLEDRSSSGDKFRPPIKEPAKEAAAPVTLDVSELTHQRHRESDFQLWFLRNRKWVAAVAFGTLILGVLKMVLRP